MAEQGITHLVTNAPEVYDGFGTVTVDVLLYRDPRKSDQFLRRVRVQNEHFGWQVDRYASGLFYRLSDDEFRQHVEAGLFVPFELTPEQQRADDQRRAAIAFAEAANQVLTELREQFVDGEPSEGLRAAAGLVVQAVSAVADYLLAGKQDDATDRVSLEAWEHWL
jgi:hypothetical protein